MTLELYYGPSNTRRWRAWRFKRPWVRAIRLC